MANMEIKDRICIHLFFAVLHSWCHTQKSYFSSLGRQTSSAFCHTHPSYLLFWSHKHSSSCSCLSHELSSSCPISHASNCVLWFLISSAWRLWSISECWQMYSFKVTVRVKKWAIEELQKTFHVSVGFLCCFCARQEFYFQVICCILNQIRILSFI